MALVDGDVLTVVVMAAMEQTSLITGLVVPEEEAGNIRNLSGLGNTSGRMEIVGLLAFCSGTGSG